MNKILYIIAVTGMMLAAGVLYDQRLGDDQLFIMGVAASFLALSVALVAFNLSVQHRNRLTPYLGLSFLAAGIIELLRILFAKGVLLSPVAPIDNFNAVSGVIDQAVFSIILSLGMVHAFKGRGIWSVLPHYTALTVLLSGTLMVVLTRIPLPYDMLAADRGLYRALELAPCIGYGLFFAAVVKARARKQSVREYLLGRALLPCVLVLLVSQLVLWTAPDAYHGATGIAVGLNILAYVLALVAANVNLWRYSEYSFQVAGARLATVFSIALLMLSLFSVVQFDRYEREIKNNDEQALVALLRKQHQLNHIEFAIQNYLLFAEQQYLDDLDPLWKLQKDISGLLKGRIKQQDLREINQRFLALQSMSRKVLSIDAEGEVGHKVFIAEQLLTGIQQLRKYLGRILDQESRELSISKQQKVTNIHDQLVSELALLLSIILFVVGFSRRHYWNQVQPVINLNEVAKRITSGQWDIEINTDRKDELGALGNSINAMLKHLRSTMDELEDRVNERTEELGRSERQLRSIMDNVDEAIITANDRGIIESVNSAASDIFGYEQQEMIGSPIYHLMPADKREPHINAISQYYEQGIKKVLGEHGRHETALRKDGSTFPIEIGVTEVIKDEKRVFIAVLRDVTEAQKAETALRESEQRLSRFFDASLEGLLFHERGHIVDANNAALALLDCHMWDIVGKDLA
ncbi:MAG: PAS domain S-box protein, partial [Gammaproteobacteria bacterium]